MPGRGYKGSNDYRYGFNGKELDKETSIYDYGMRIYNPAIGRFLSIDPLFKGFPWNSTYSYAENTPIWTIDLDGLETVLYNRSPWFGDLISGYTGCQEGAYLSDGQWEQLQKKLMSVHNAYFTLDQLEYVKKVTGYAFDNENPGKIQFHYVENPGLHEIHIYGWSEKSKAYKLLAKYKVPQKPQNPDYEAKHWLDQWWDDLKGYLGITSKGNTGTPSDWDICSDLNPFWCGESDDVIPNDTKPDVNDDNTNNDKKGNSGTPSNDKNSGNGKPGDVGQEKPQETFKVTDNNGNSWFEDKSGQRVNQDGTPIQDSPYREYVSPRR